MLKQSPSRNLRSKGFKVKHAVQICILFAIGIWLLYRAKHSHAKGAGYEEDTTTSTADLLEETTRGAYDVLKFGRKGLKPRVEETKVATGEEKKHREEEEDETEDKDEDATVDAGGGGDDEAEGQGQYRFEDIGGDLGDGFVGEDEDGDSEDEGENDDLGIDKKSREALEEHYKGDDASSAVFQNSKAMATNTENGVLRRVITDKENGALRSVMEQQENRYQRMEDADEDVVNDSKLNHRNKVENFQQTMSVSAVNNEEKDATDSKVSHFKQSNESLTRRAIVLPEPAQLRNVKSLGNGTIIPIVMVEHNPNTIRTENEQFNYKANLPSIASDSDDNNRAKGIEDTSQLSKTSEITETVLMETLDSWEGASDF